MSTKWGMLVGALLIAALIIFLWPAPDPLQGVETVALAGPGGDGPGLASEVLQGLEIALGEHRIRIVEDPSQADAVITVEHVELQEIEVRLGEDGFARAHAVLLITKDRQKYLMDLYVTLDETGLKARLVGRKFWEFWK
jgi:hypothetical protein